MQNQITGSASVPTLNTFGLTYNQNQIIPTQAENGQSAEFMALKEISEHLEAKLNSMQTQI